VYHSPTETHSQDLNIVQAKSEGVSTIQVTDTKTDPLDQIEQLKQLSLVIGETLDQQNSTLDSIQDNSEQNVSRLAKTKRRATKMS
jgi:Cu/Zn superoxide dismutase